MTFKIKPAAVLYIAFAANIVLLACSQGTNVNTQRKEILALHDSVMALNSPLVAQQIVLDSLAGAPRGLAPAIVNKARKYKKQTDSLEEGMDYWMQHFDAETGNKTEKEIRAYFSGEQKKVIALEKGYRRQLEANKLFLDSAMGTTSSKKSSK